MKIGAGESVEVQSGADDAVVLPVLANKVIINPDNVIELNTAVGGKGDYTETG